MIIAKRLFLFLLVIFMTNAIHGAIAWEPIEPYWAALPKRNQLELQKLLALEESFYQELGQICWPNPSTMPQHLQATFMQKIENYYGISSLIFSEPYSVQQAYTDMLIDFIKQHAAGENLLRIAIFNRKIVDLMVDKTLLQPLVNYAHTQLNDSKFSYELSYAQKDILWKYKQFIGTKKPSGHQRETRTTIQTTFHSLLCFWFFKTFKKKSVTFAQQDSSNFEDGAGSCCRCW